ncbi:MAG: SCP2 sterol-binding domain-containing protein [Candidatus Methylomirabilis sp.]|nr:SCP2 sterol-binding domain-containing protein [Deltaproteobacteria bacterium]
MSAVAAKFQEMGEKISGNPAESKKVNAVYKFNVTGEGGGTWVVDLKNDPPGVKEGDGDAQCTITIAAQDFLDLVSGKLNGQMAFMSGKLKIAGDMSLAMKLGQVMNTAKS